MDELENFKEVLKEMRFTEKENENIIKLFGEKNYVKMIKELNKKRKLILGKIHKEERQISKLDYLIFEIQKLGGLKYGI
mgnify:CR=1 FL=1